MRLGRLGGLGLGVPQDALAWEDPPSSCSGLGRKHVTAAGGPEAMEPPLSVWSRV